MIEWLFVVGVAVVSLVLGVFVLGWRYRGGEPEFSPVEIEWLRERAEGRISVLSPRVMVLAEKERTVTWSLYGSRARVELRGAVEELLVEAAADDFWGRFFVASASVEERPVEAFEELGRLQGLLEEIIYKLERAERLCMDRRVA